MENAFTPNGLIGKSGKFYPCEFGQHNRVRTPMADAPYVSIHCNMAGTYAGFDAYYSWEHAVPTDSQYEALMDYCTKFGERFEDMTDCWDAPWEKWRKSE